MHSSCKECGAHCITCEALGDRVRFWWFHLAWLPGHNVDTGHQRQHFFGYTHKSGGSSRAMMFETLGGSIMVTS